jgi:tRNA-specific 2-thiouridylase
MRVLVGMSGGVDSTVVAMLLKEQGYDVEGVYMKMYDDEAKNQDSYSKAKRVASYLDIKLHHLNIQDEFKKDVYDYFVNSYKAGLTPNPCIVCNRTIKFGKMMEFADSLGIDKVATGHYLKSDGKYIYMAKDREKDQSYFLAKIDKSVVPRLIFPLGEWDKSDVKAYGAKIEILKDIATQKESSEICFVDNTYEEILQKHMDIDIPGKTLDTQGNVVGHHKGYMHYTIGKRRGFFVNGAHDPHYVLQINPQSNEIVVGTKEKLEVNEFEIDDISLFDDMDEFEASVKVRYRTQAIPCSVKITDGKGKIKLKQSVFGLAHGQPAAFYDDDRLLGGGTIL